MAHHTHKQMIEGYPTLAAHAGHLELALHDVLNGAVTWSGWHSETAQDPMSTGRYRAGICRANTDPIVMVTFRVHGQSDLIWVYRLESYLPSLRQTRLSSPRVQPILDAITDAQSKLDGLRRDQEAY